MSGVEEVETPVDEEPMTGSMTTADLVEIRESVVDGQPTITMIYSLKPGTMLSEFLTDYMTNSTDTEKLESLISMKLQESLLKGITRSIITDGTHYVVAEPTPQAKAGLWICRNVKV